MFFFAGLLKVSEDLSVQEAVLFTEGSFEDVHVYAEKICLEQSALEKCD
jgi:hypothetical protein